MITIVNIYLNNGNKVTLHESFNNFDHVDNSLKDETQGEWYCYERNSVKGAFLRSEVKSFEIVK